MAFKLTAFEARSLELQNVSFKRGIQQVVLTITAANTDTDLDIGDETGTFWTAAQADGTYGGMAALALAALKAIMANAAHMIDWHCPQLTGYIQAAVPAGSQYQVAVDTLGYDFTLASGSAPTSYKMIFDVELIAGAFPVVSAYNL